LPIAGRRRFIRYACGQRYEPILDLGIRVVCHGMGANLLKRVEASVRDGPRIMNDKASFISFLDFMRWLAALLVVMSHSRRLIFEDYAAVDAPGVLSTIFYFVTGYGHQAVIVFFVLSGYLVGGTSISKSVAEKFDRLGYGIARFSRIYTVYVPCLVFTWLLDAIVRLYLGAPWLLEIGLENQLFRSLSEANNTAFVFIGNLAMMQEILVPVYGSNFPLWSLSYEFWYYVLCYFFVVALTEAILRRKLLWLALFMILLISLPQPIQKYFAIWCMGALAFFIQPPTKSSWFVPLSLFCIFSCLVLARIGPESFSIFSLDMLLSLSTCVLIVSMKQKEIPALECSATLNAKLANFSYTLYLFHFPLLSLFVAAIYTYNTKSLVVPLNAETFALYVLGILTLVGVCRVIAFFTEDHTPVVRVWLLRAAAFMARRKHKYI
jgi:peptidoglycan/LPS O-acetylase OafA/YrhL